ncbi:hypothetical protein LPJ53_002941 [Coemansia erecta]|uniref:Uncharacterized protein n=1 Tax=Coemansia erecta TaxID=147472 RepID=A0A9W8CT03_9FUNG|nr:hypothetical protein LPJ53_002941 [Coemansia erecta]
MHYAASRGRGSGSGGSSGGQQRQGAEPVSPEADELPTYEETVSFRKRYALRYPQLLSRTVHAVDSDLGRAVYAKRMHGLSTNRSTYYALPGGGGDGGGGGGAAMDERVIWRCQRRRQGFELVFTREREEDGEREERERQACVEEEAEAEAETEIAEEEVDELVDVGAVDDIIGTTQALLDTKPGDTAPPDIPPPPPPPPARQPPPPAYAESEAHPSGPTSETVVLISPVPTPFTYDFELRSHGRNGRLRWTLQRQQQQQQRLGGAAKRGTVEFCCIERASGRVLAEIVAAEDSAVGAAAASLGTLVLHGRDLPRGVHEFLVVSAIAVAEEYPVRQVAMLN